MESRLKHRNQCAFLCLFLALQIAQVRAVDLQDPQIPGWSTQRHLGNAELRLGASCLKPWGEPTSSSNGLHLRGAANVGSRRRALADSDLLSSQVPRAQMLPSRRAATEKLTANHIEVEALMSFKAGISGGNVSLFGNWDAKDATPCTWVGVSCSTDVQRVSALNLGGYKLEGRISSALRALSGLEFLRSVDLSDNMLGSSISGASLLNFSSLASMNLSYNQLEGEIPVQIGDLANLQSLALQYNNLSGQIPSSIGNCSSLRVLNLRANLLSGHIPHEIGRLIHLEALWLGNDANPENDLDGRYGNALTGSIPASLGNCSSLTLLNLDLNLDLGGEIPQELSQLRSLQIFSCINCNLEGALPGWIGNLTNLVEIHLNYNNLDGTLPAEIGRLRNLSWIALGRNNLTGRFPPGLANCTSLARLRIAANFITGVIPPGLGNLSFLIDINVGRNPLSSGPIPPWLSSMPQLEIICVDQTNRQGEISSELGSLSRLEWVDFSQNNLEGPIPSSLWNCTDLVILKLYENSLTGHLSSKVGDLTNLVNLVVGSNYLSGSIPLSITNLTLLKDVEVLDNSFTGTIDGQWGQLSLLTGFYFNYNLLVGSIPWSLGNCSSLVTVSVSKNHLTGDIPASLGNLSQLLEIYVGGNRLSGKVPVELAQCPQLSALSLASNQLEGPFPPEIGRLPFLTYLSVSHNMLTGDIANFFGNSSQIVEIDLSYNRFRASVSMENVSDSFQYLQSFNISHNSISGPLFFDWRKLVYIQEIDVSANEISGTIPNLEELQSLRTLDVSLNNFSGHIPEVLASLPDLVFFNASYNNFDGPIPAFQTPQSNITAASFLGNPGLCGAVLGPSRECPSNTSMSSRAKCEGFECAQVWIPVTVAGLACIFLVFAMVAWAVRRSIEARNEFDVKIDFSLNLLKFSPNDILAIIQDEENVIGTTADSVVYRGSLPGYEDMIAVKTFVGHKSDHKDPGRAASLKNLLDHEATLQASLRHRNVLKLLSYCSHASFKALLLEYMPQGSLHDHLYPADGKTRDEGKGPDQNCKLPWSERFGIAMNVAEGMTYLHHECPEPLIHGDLKPSNVLLDEEMVAKVSDFGIARAINPRRAGGELGDGEVTVSRICGTIGYMPPEYAYVTSVSTKGDVFSYGVLLLEMLSGSPPSAIYDDFEESTYRARMLHRFQETPSELLDSALQHEGRKDALTTKQMMLLGKIAFLCTRESSQSRPSMENVRSMLMQIQGLEVNEAPLRTLEELAQENELDVDGWESADPDVSTSEFTDTR